MDVKMLIRVLFAACVMKMEAYALTITAYAKGELDIDWIEHAGNGTFDRPLEAFKEIVASGYGFIMAIAAPILIFALIYAALKMPWGNRMAKDEAWGKILDVIKAAFIVFSAVSIITLIAQAAQSAFR